MEIAPVYTKQELHNHSKQQSLLFKNWCDKLSTADSVDHVATSAARRVIKKTNEKLYDEFLKTNAFGIYARQTTDSR